MNALYARPTDEIGRDATLALTTGTADASYPVTNVQDFDPTSVFLTSDSVGADLVFDHGASVDVQGFSLHQHNIPAGTTGVMVQRNATNSWGAPSLNYQPAIEAFPNTGLPLPLAVDLRTVSGYGSYRYSRFHVPDLGGSPSGLIGLGSVLWWATLREDLTNVRYPVFDGENHPQRVFPTAYGKKRRYRMGVRLRRQPSTFLFRTAAVYATFLALRRSCADGQNALLWWRDPSISDAPLMEFSEDDLVREINPCHSVTVMLEEIACGLAIPTAA